MTFAMNHVYVAKRKNVCSSTSKTAKIYLNKMKKSYIIDSNKIDVMKSSNLRVQEIIANYDS